MKAPLGVGKLFWAEDIKVAFSAECDGGKEVFFKRSNLASFKERWPYAKDVANTFQSLAKQNKLFINEQLQTIISRGM